MIKKRKGIILAGGNGTRLHPLTVAVSKQLLPVYDKPMIYYSLTVLMLAGVTEILIITKPEDRHLFEKLLGDGVKWGLSISYEVQMAPEGISQAYILAEEFLDGGPSVLILGDNLFFGNGLPELLNSADKQSKGASVFAYYVKNPENYGVVKFDMHDKVIEIVEKPDVAPSPYAVTGLYFLDEKAPQYARNLVPSVRGELEITSLLQKYIVNEDLHVNKMGRGYAWFDTGTYNSLLDAGNFVRTLTERQGLQVGSPEEVAYKMNFISREQLELFIGSLERNAYGDYLTRILSIDH